MGGEKKKKDASRRTKTEGEAVTLKPNKVTLFKIPPLFTLNRCQALQHLVIKPNVLTLSIRILAHIVSVQYTVLSCAERCVA